MVNVFVLQRFFVLLFRLMVWLTFSAPWGPNFGSQKWTQKWASDSDFDTVLIVEARMGHIFGSVFGAHFWAPDL